MTRKSLNLWTVAGLAVILVAAATGAGAGDRDGWTGKWRTVVVDENGERHEETIELDGTRPFLGVELGRAGDRGARVDGIIEDSAAERAGLQEGDMIVGFEGREIKTAWDLTREVLKSEPGTRVDLEILRDGSRETLTAEIGESEGWVGAFSYGGDGEVSLDFDDYAEHMNRHVNSDAFNERMKHLEDRLGNARGFAFSFQNRPRLGVELVDTTPELREHLGARADEGVLVGRVMENLPAGSAGVEVGDLIVAVDGESVGSHGDLARLLQQRDGETFGIEVIRDGRPLSLTVALPERDEEGAFPGRFRGLRGSGISDKT